MARRMVLAAAAIAVLVTGAPHPSRAQEPLLWVGTLNVKLYTEYYSEPRMQGGGHKEIIAWTKCRVEYLRTRARIRPGTTATMWFSYHWQSVETYPSATGQKTVKNTIDVNQQSPWDSSAWHNDVPAKAPLDPAFFVWQLSNDRYLIVHNIYTARFRGTVTGEVDGRQTPPQETWITSNCRDRERVEFSKQDAYVRLPFHTNGGVIFRGEFLGTDPPERGWQSFAWDLDKVP